jgi:hypothetical protein
MKRVLTVSIAALLLVGLTAPLVLAKPGDDRPGRRDDEMRASHEPAAKGMLPGEKASERSHRVRDAFIISVSAQGLSADNESYSISGSGMGLAKSKMVNETVKAIHGFAKVNITLKDANGSIVKEGAIRVHFHAHQNETGDWTWRLVSAGKTPKGLPKLFLHGENVTLSEGQADLDGKGFALAKIQDGDETKRLRLRLDADIHLAKA